MGGEIVDLPLRSLPPVCGLVEEAGSVGALVSRGPGTLPNSPSPKRARAKTPRCSTAWKKSRVWMVVGKNRLAFTHT